MAEQLTADSIRVGRIYAAKRPQRTGNIFEAYWNDRIVRWISADRQTVQYDGPTVPIGRRLPQVSMDAFLKWAGADITDNYPVHDWRKA